MGWERGRRLKREGIYVYRWLIHVDVWQKPTQYGKAIILQKIFFKKKSWENSRYGNMLPTSNGYQHTTDSKHTTVGGDGVAVARGEEGACLGFADVVTVRMRVGKEFPDMRQNKVY